MGRMPDDRSSGHADLCSLRSRLAALAVGLSVLLSACSSGQAPDALASTAPASSRNTVSAATARPLASGGGGEAPCSHVAAVEDRLASLEAVELRLPNRVALDIELGKLKAAYGELRQADLGPFEEQLETPLQRLGYRLAALELAVEDFRTNSRPQLAVSHVETDAGTFGDELAAFAILARC